MKLFLMIETRTDNYKEGEKEDLCWKMMEGTDVYNMVARESIKELQEALSEKSQQVTNNKGVLVVSAPLSDALSEYQENHNQQSPTQVSIRAKDIKVGDKSEKSNKTHGYLETADNQEKQKEDSAHQESGICGETPIPGIESDTLRSRTDESDSLILKKSCKNCHYYEPDFNGKECCTFEIFTNPGRVKELPKEEVCDNFANQKESAEVKG